MSEEEIMMNQEKFGDRLYSYYVANPQIPHFLIDEEVGETRRAELEKDFAMISKLYYIYQMGNTFSPEASNGDYIPSQLRYKKAAMIINKEARFFFSHTPTFTINHMEMNGEADKNNTIVQAYLDRVMQKNNFSGKLLKGLKDCFIAGRVGIMLNFNEERGITITFLNALSFVFEVSDYDENELTKFVGFTNVVKSGSLAEQRWFKKSYTKDDTGVYVEEKMFSGNGELIDVVTPKTKILFDYIPATVVVNDGLTGDTGGVSELFGEIEYEKYYSKLANADMDAQRKSMHPTRYTVDASNESTANLSTSPGSYWDIQTDQQKVNENASAKVGLLEATMAYSDPLKTTLDRIENEMFEEVDVPNITSEQLAGVITSGKTIQALYWGLTVRCDEKMLAWGYSLSFIATAIIEGGWLYPNCIKKYTDVAALPKISLDIKVENNYPIPQDITEEKQSDMAEVELKIRSRKSYNRKWMELTSEKADEELDQIKKETDMLENSMFDFGEDSESDAEDESTDTADKDREQVNKDAKQE